MVSRPGDTVPAAAGAGEEITAERPPIDPEEPPPHVAMIIALAEIGWYVTEIRPSVDAPVQWRVAIKRHDGALAIVVLDATDPDAALEELLRYAAVDAEDYLP